MSETSVLRSNASPKNASPHMSGGRNHTQLSTPNKPIVNVMPNQVVTGRAPQRAMPQPAYALPTQPQQVQYVEDSGQDFEAAAAAPKPMVQVRMPGADDGGGGVRPPTSVGGAKPMVQINMNNGKPQIASKNQPRSNVQIMNRGGGPARSPRPARNQPPMLMAPPVQQFSNEQLMLCRHAVNKYLENETNELTTAIAKSTLETIDAVLSGAPARQAVVQQEESAPAPRSIQSGGGRVAGVGAVRRFNTANTARRVVPPPAAIEVEPAEFEQPADVIDVEAEAPELATDDPTDE